MLFVPYVMFCYSPCTAAQMSEFKQALLLSSAKSKKGTFAFKGWLSIQLVSSFGAPKSMSVADGHFSTVQSGNRADLQIEKTAR